MFGVAVFIDKEYIEGKSRQGPSNKLIGWRMRERFLMDVHWSEDKSWFSVSEAFTGNSLSVLQFLACMCEISISYSPVPFLNGDLFMTFNQEFFHEAGQTFYHKVEEKIFVNHQNNQ